MEQSFKNQMAFGAMKSDKESDEIKRVLLEGNPVLLGVTMVVSLLHTLFDMLAFKNGVPTPPPPTKSSTSLTTGFDRFHGAALPCSCTRASGLPSSGSPGASTLASPALPS
jgi:hypothetical protein